MPNDIIIIACGTSWHAGLIGEYVLEEFARIPVEVEYASEFRYRNPVINKDDIVIAISQSGETADTLAAIELAQNKRCIYFWNLQCGWFIHCTGNTIQVLTPTSDRKSELHLQKPLQLRLRFLP